MLLQKPVWLVCSILFLAVYTQPTHSKKLLIVLGDGLSDVTNTYSGSQRAYPPRAAYWNGRFTGKPGNWVDHLTFYMDLTAVNHAIGGARACEPPAPPPPPPPQGQAKGGKRVIQVPEPPHVARARANSLSGQYMKYKKKLERDKEFQRRVAEEGRVVLVWLGHAEVLELIEQGTEEGAATRQLKQVVKCIGTNARGMLKDGEKSLVIGTLVPLDLSPFVLEGGSKPHAAKLVSLANQLIREEVAAVASESPNATIVLWDVAQESLPVVENWELEGFTKNTSCVTHARGTSVASILNGTAPTTSICPDPQTHLWHDRLHPSSKVHGFAADVLQSLLVNQGLAAVNPQAPIKTPTFYLKPVTAQQAMSPSSHGIGRSHTALDNKEDEEKGEDEGKEEEKEDAAKIVAPSTASKQDPKANKGVDGARGDIKPGSQPATRGEQQPEKKQAGSKPKGHVVVRSQVQGAVARGTRTSRAAAAAAAWLRNSVVRQRQTAAQIEQAETDGSVQGPQRLPVAAVGAAAGPRKRRARGMRAWYRS